MTNLFDKIYCINLDHRTDRWEECQEEFKKWSIPSVDRVSAVDGTVLYETGKYKSKQKACHHGLCLTNVKIFIEALQEGSETILIMEDDVCFTEEIKDISKLINLVPADWDVLYFGANHCTQEGKAPPIKINEKVVKVHHSKATHCIAFRQRTFHRVIEVLSKQRSHSHYSIDVKYLNTLQKEFNAYCFYPPLAVQRPSYSDICSRDANYNVIKRKLPGF